MDIISSYGSAGMDISGYEGMPASVAASATPSFWDGLSLGGVADSFVSGFQSLGSAAINFAGTEQGAGLIAGLVGGKKTSPKTPEATRAQALPATVSTPWVKYALFGGAALIGVFLIVKIAKA